ncbi:hypothetical protein [Bacillus litorisediminis]|uniref:hypothetical protein n=1 Tax=Bacillus litorisediminis TaxID=2922713 RepID=UPI001FACF90C|nr:hypothetical protein [Bacillus litorisediminis]
MDNTYLTEEINNWNNQIRLNHKLYELAFFKIFVKFELFLTNTFIGYATGESSIKGYTPERKLNFEDKAHLVGVLRNYRSSFIDYSEKIQQISKFIFLEEKDPFSLIFNDSKFYNYFIEMKYIRNYIAHESQESRIKYHKYVLKNKPFEEPNDFLKKINKKNSKTYYSIYIDIIREFSEVILDPTPFL